jgi:hypothetical protein
MHNRRFFAPPAFALDDGIIIVSVHAASLNRCCHILRTTDRRLVAEGPLDAHHLFQRRPHWTAGFDAYP